MLLFNSQEKQANSTSVEIDIEMIKLNKVFEVLKSVLQIKTEWHTVIIPCINISISSLKKRVRTYHSFHAWDFNIGVILFGGLRIDTLSSYFNRTEKNLFSWASANFFQREPGEGKRVSLDIQYIYYLQKSTKKK